MAATMVEAPSPSGDEGPALRVAEKMLREAGLTVERQEVGSPGRFNLFAWHGRPRVVLTTHLDTVPGHLPVRVEGGALHGRGACDAKGIAAAMIAAAQALREEGRSDFGVLLVVGEETTSDGAIAADAAVAARQFPWEPEHAMFGEPTGNRFVKAHPGVLLATVSTTGRAAHSACPEQGASAIHALLDLLADLRFQSWPGDALLGRTLFQVGRIEGGTAANVVADQARAEVMFRSGVDPTLLEQETREIVGSKGAVDVWCSSRPVRFDVPQALHDQAVLASFSTDAPFLPSLGRPYLCGPGSILDAHTDHERISADDMTCARDIYVKWAQRCLDARREATA
jgi:acetylornithine deacetylase